VKAVAVPTLAHRLGALAPAGIDSAAALVHAALGATPVGR
jgi:hypothetical protein